MSIFHLLYRSEASHELAPAQLVYLLQQARAFNHAHSVTGILLHAPGHFLQVLEGGRTEVEALYARIRRDERHRQVLTLTQGQTSRRVFPAWSMGFLAASASEFERLVGHVSPVRVLPGAGQPLALGPGLLALLQEFAEARIVQF